MFVHPSFSLSRPSLIAYLPLRVAVAVLFVQPVVSLCGRLHCCHYRTYIGCVFFSKAAQLEMQFCFTPSCGVNARVSGLRASRSLGDAELREGRGMNVVKNKALLDVMSRVRKGYVGFANLFGMHFIFPGVQICLKQTFSPIF